MGGVEISAVFVPGFTFEKPNDLASMAVRCRRAADHYDLKASVAEKRGRHARARYMAQQRDAYLNAAARHEAEADTGESD